MIASMAYGGEAEALQVPSTSPAAIAKARARLALRAEQAWGVQGLIGVELHASGLQGPTRFGGSAIESAPLRVMNSVGAEVPRAPGPAPVVDLFGNRQAAKRPLPEEIDPGFPEPPLTREKRVELLRALDEGEVRVCAGCALGGTRRNTVFGEGDPEAQLMFIGEGPGETEDATGRPFVGRAGELLDRMIAGMGLKREQVYIANVVKCRPPNNRVPTAVEVSTCTPYLHKQIEWIRPKVIVTLGLPATRHLLRTSLSMGALRGKWSQWSGIKVMPTYHPAYLLRSYTPENRRIVWNDLQQVMAELGLQAR